VHARVTLLEIDTVRVPLHDAVATFADQVAPRLRSQPGYRGVYALATPEGKAMLVSFWDTAEQADSNDTNVWYSDVLAEFVTLFRAPPGREHYEVRFAEHPSGADAFVA
jgi:hypothetical protein